MIVPAAGPTESRAAPGHTRRRIVLTRVGSQCDLHPDIAIVLGLLEERTAPGRLATR
jgi:hypothetical protein